MRRTGAAAGTATRKRRHRLLLLAKVARAQDIPLLDQERNKEIVVGDKDRKYKKRMKELIHRQAAEEINKAVEGKGKS